MTDDRAALTARLNDDLRAMPPRRESLVEYVLANRDEAREEALRGVWDWVRAVEFEFAEGRPKILGVERGPSKAVWYRFRAAKEVRAILEQASARPSGK